MGLRIMVPVINGATGQGAMGREVIEGSVASQGIGHRAHGVEGGVRSTVWGKE